MTDPIAEEAATVLAEADYTVIYKGYLASIDEVVEHVKAADTLGLGFRVESYIVSSTDEPNAGHGEFEFTLLAEMPERQESDE